MALLEPIGKSEPEDGSSPLNGKLEVGDKKFLEKATVVSLKNDSPSPLNGSYADINRSPSPLNGSVVNKNVRISNGNPRIRFISDDGEDEGRGGEDGEGREWGEGVSVNEPVKYQPGDDNDDADGDADREDEGEPEIAQTSTPVSLKAGLRRLTQRENLFKRRLSAQRVTAIDDDDDLGTPSKPRRPFSKVRSKSDAEVMKTSSFFKGSRKSIDNDNLTQDEVTDVHSDTELPNDHGSSSNIGTRKKFMSYMGPGTFLGESSRADRSGSGSGSGGGAGGAGGGGGGGGSGERERGESKVLRRISQFNREGIYSNLRKYTTLNFMRKKKEERPEEYEKSAELLNEILSGTPASLILASSFVHDEKGFKKVNVLLEQIRFKFTELTPGKLFKIDLQYGSGPARLEWSLQKEYKDFVSLHRTLKSVYNIKRLAQKSEISDKPRRLGVKFPKIPRPAYPKYRRTSTSLVRTTSLDRVSTRTQEGAGAGYDFVVSSSDSEQDDLPARGVTGEARTFVGALEEYFSGLLHKYQFSGDANKILQFLEISNMSIRLAPEQSFHGKEGRLYIRSFASEQGWRVRHWKANDIMQMIRRHRGKWFLVRHSYIVCVDNIASTDIREVFLVDYKFTATARISNEPFSDGDDTFISLNHHQPIQTGISSTAHEFSRKYFLEITNNERVLKMAARSEREVSNWIESINKMKEQSNWSKSHRFDSFAPVRRNVHAQWFVDARDYFWSVSEAISNAKDVIYIHDWWLSPELYLRRPPQGNQQWRLDRLLQRKAIEGVKIFIIVYRNYGQTVPIDSSYTKYSLLDLHKNIYVMRSPNQWLQNTYFWAHHEKLCLIDHSVAYLGGIDLCFGRYDTPDHVLTDDKQDDFFTNPHQEIFPETQIWVGKDYSNPRVQDFTNLHEPYENMYDRQKVPRMPWHDIHMMVAGQPARDLVRHFVQRWNFLIRQKRPSRYTPLLVPPPEFTEEDLQTNGMSGTCEVQILRSCCSWSSGVKEEETSIEKAYVTAIEASEHFVYIENQFFITSTTVEGTKIENRIGNALVERIIKAYENNENWKCVIIIPLMPGFESQVDMAEGSSVRVIMKCQYMSIGSGPDSIFARLEAMRITPSDYIQFFSLRKWGKIGINKKIVTEQLYVHAKCMVVDDRVAIIGSANINERSMRGIRDSEIAAIVRDSHVINSTMAGESYEVGKFPHSLRVRLMSEHLGVDLDAVELINSQLETLVDPQESDNENELFPMEGSSQPPVELHSFNHCAGIDNIGLREEKTISTDSRIQNNKPHKEDIAGRGKDGLSVIKEIERRREEVRKKQSEEVVQRADSIINEAFFNDELTFSNIDSLRRKLYEQITETTVHDSFDISSNVEDLLESNEAPSRVSVNPFNIHDPLDRNFYEQVWLTIAKQNTNIFREVFRCQPDDKVRTWKEYKDFMSYGEKFSTQQDRDTNQPVSSTLDTLRAHDPLGAMANKDEDADDTSSLEEGDGEEESSSKTSSKTSSESNNNNNNGNVNNNNTDDHHNSHRNHHNSSNKKPQQQPASKTIIPATSSSTIGQMKSIRHKRSSPLENEYIRTEPYSSEEAEKILTGVKGHLVMFPTQWLDKELKVGNWFHNFDRLPPLEIYN